MKRIHVSISGHEHRFDDPEPKLERFLKRVYVLVEDRKATEDDMIALVYGKENPLLEATRGVVTREVLGHDLYPVLADLIVRKRFAQEGTDPAKVAAKHSISVAEAAERKGVSEDAIRRAARDGRLPSWVKGGSYFFEPKTLDAVQLGKRGPMPEGTEPLEAHVGYDGDERVQFNLKAPDYDQIEGPARDVRGGSWAGNQKIPRWRRVGVLTGGGGKLRFFEIEPSSEKNELSFGKFFVRGKFAFVRKVNSPEKARKAWAAFVAS